MIATWPMTSVVNDKPASARLNSIRSDSPMARVGNISGDRKSASSPRAHPSFRRASARAAATDSTTESAVASAANSADNRKASTSSGESLHNASYQRAEYPGGGNFNE